MEKYTVLDKTKKNDNKNYLPKFDYFINTKGKFNKYKLTLLFSERDTHLLQ